MDLPKVKAFLANADAKAGFYLHEKHWHSGFVEYLIRNNYKFLGTDCWLVWDKSNDVEHSDDAGIVDVTPERFDDFYKVLSIVFKDFSGNEQYLKICRQSLGGGIKNGIDDFQSKFFLIYEGNEPVSGAGVFFSQKENFAYFHNAGTLENFRGKGYQTNLIRHRLNLVRDLGIDRIYTLTELGSQSWQNYLRLGFVQKQVALILSPK